MSENHLEIIAADRLNRRIYNYAGDDLPKEELSSIETLHELKRLVDNAIEMEKTGLMRDCSPEDCEHYRKMFAYDLVLGPFGIKRI